MDNVNLQLKILNLKVQNTKIVNLSSLLLLKCKYNIKTRLSETESPFLQQDRLPTIQQLFEGEESSPLIFQTLHRVSR